MPSNERIVAADVPSDERSLRARRHGRCGNRRRWHAHEPAALDSFSQERFDLALQDSITRTRLRQKCRTVRGRVRQRRVTQILDSPPAFSWHLAGRRAAPLAATVSRFSSRA